MEISDEIINCGWLFARGDMLSDKFEEWVYSFPTLEDALPQDFYMKLISANYIDPAIVYEIEKDIREFLLINTKRDCECQTLANLADIEMGLHKQAFSTLEEKKKYGEPLWWLWLAQCRNCDQFWLVASEERINDIFLLNRLTELEGSHIVEKNIWPDRFKTFGELLEIGRNRGHHWEFDDPLCSSLVQTVIDLAKAKPGIPIFEIGALLQINAMQAKALVDEAIKHERLDISF